MIILGIDCSSTTIGYCILKIIDNNISLIHVSYLKPPKKGNIIERIAKTRDMIQDIIDKYQPDEIAIEDIIKFLPNKSSAQTIIMLSVFNRCACLLAYDYLQKSPALYSVMTIRHGLKLTKELPKKENMPGLVSQRLGITFPYEYNRKNKQRVENMDMADGIAVALYHAYILTGKIKKKKSKS